MDNRLNWSSMSFEPQDQPATGAAAPEGTPDATRDTTWDSTRARFVKSLPQRITALEQTLSFLAGRPGERHVQDQLLRQLQTLLASVEVFSLEALVPRLREACGWVDRLIETQSAATPADVQGLDRIMAQIRSLANQLAQISVGSQAGAALQQTVLPPADIPVPLNVAPPVTTAPPNDFPLSNLAAPLMPNVSASKSSTPELLPGSSATVLIIDSADVQAQVRASLPGNHFEVKGVEDTDEALRWARSGTPDVLLVDQRFITGPDAEVITRLRSDPLTDFIPVIVMATRGAGIDRVALREQGVDDVVEKPIDGLQLIQALGRALGLLASMEQDSFGDRTCEEVADRVIAEIKRGLIERVQNGRDLRIPMGDGAEILAATWAAIASVRAQITHRSGGRVVFADPPARHGPALLSLSSEEVLNGLRSSEVNLRERRVVVVDDDPAVAWFFAGVLRAEGMDVVESSGGQEALKLVREKRPDVIISDILMPGMDGFVLCRELSRDPALADVPVILISWKEDFILRMRELHASAVGYLRKEAGSNQIIARVRQALLPVAVLENKLISGVEARGRIEEIGIVNLIQTVAKHRPNARMSIRDAWSLYEVQVRGGQLVDVSLTGREGIFARGEHILPQLLGCNTGRYAVVVSDSEVRGTLQGELGALIEKGAEQLGALLDSVSGISIMNVYKVVLDAKMVEAFAATSPKTIANLIQRLHAGEGPRFLLLNSDVDPQQLEFVLRELARRGALREVHGPRGQDRVALSLRAWRADVADAEPTGNAEERPTIEFIAGEHLPIGVSVAGVDGAPSQEALPPLAEEATAHDASVQMALVAKERSTSERSASAPSAQEVAVQRDALVSTELVETVREKRPSSLPPRTSDADSTMRDVSLSLEPEQFIRAEFSGFKYLALGVLIAVLGTGGWVWFKPWLAGQMSKKHADKIERSPAPQTTDRPSDTPAASTTQSQSAESANAAGWQPYIKVLPANNAALKKDQGAVLLPKNWPLNKIKLVVDDTEIKPFKNPVLLDKGYHEIRAYWNGSVSMRFVVVVPGKALQLE